MASSNPETSDKAPERGDFPPSSEFVTMNVQLVSKIASLESTVLAGFRRLDEKMDRFQSDLHESQLSTNDRINNLDKEFNQNLAFKRQRIDALERDQHELRNEMQIGLSEVNTWQQVAMAKVGIIVTVFGLVWVVLAPTIRNILGIAG